LLAVGMGAIEVGMVWVTHQAFTWLVALYAAEGCATLLIGAIAWDRRPGNRTGALLSVLGFATLVSAAGNVGVPSVAAVGSLLAVVLVASLLHLVLAFPSGRLPSRPARVLVVAGYAVTIVLQVPQFVYGEGADLYPTWGIRVRAHLVSTVHTIQLWLIFVVLVAACVEKVRSVRVERRGLDTRPPNFGVFAYGIGTLAFLALSAPVAGPVFGISALSLFAAQMVVFAWIPVVYGLGIVRSGFARTGHIEQLGAWLAVGSADLAHLRNALAATVGDPSIQLTPAADLEPGPPGSSHLEGPSHPGPLAVVTYDRTLIGDPEVVRSASQLVAIAMERQRLSAELLQSREILRESRARIVEVADQERRRLARDLHDVLQSRLILAAMHAGRLVSDVDLPEEGRSRARQLRSELEEAITDLRHQLQGLMPAMLIERGLPAAIAELADRLPLPTTVEISDGGAAVPSAVATTGYFIVAEAFTNSLKHAGATQLSVRLDREGSKLRLVVADNGVGGARRSGGSGLRGIADRVEALDGSVDVHSPHGGGTTISVALPCG
jgi:signal transduction histidine kinase